MPHGVPTENFVLFGAVEIADLRSSDWYSSNRQEVWCAIQDAESLAESGIDSPITGISNWWWVT
jgi:hypothetical protein